MTIHVEKQSFFRLCYTKVEHKQVLSHSTQLVYNPTEKNSCCKNTASLGCQPIIVDATITQLLLVAFSQRKCMCKNTASMGRNKLSSHDDVFFSCDNDQGKIKAFL